VTAQSRKLLTIRHEWLRKSTQKYGLDSLSGVNRESAFLTSFGSGKTSVCTIHDAENAATVGECRAKTEFDLCAEFPMVDHLFPRNLGVGGSSAILTKVSETDVYF